MENRNKFTIFTLIMFSFMFLGAGCSNTETEDFVYNIDKSDFIEKDSLVSNISESELSAEEISGLILMREEEKLARDVYMKLYEKWGINIFSNIASSEQTHTDAVKTLIDRYKLEDPVVNDSYSEFTSPILKDLYNNLVNQGNLSALDALKVGATVEDLDIQDLADLLEETDNEDIIITYENLQKGSRNHLRAFVKLIENYNSDYTPQYISKNLYDEIISSSQERGRK